MNYILYRQTWLSPPNAPTCWLDHDGALSFKPPLLTLAAKSHIGTYCLVGHLRDEYSHQIEIYAVGLKWPEWRSKKDRSRERFWPIQTNISNSIFFELSRHTFACKMKCAQPPSSYFYLHLVLISNEQNVFIMFWETFFVDMCFGKTCFGEKCFGEVLRNVIRGYVPLPAHNIIARLQKRFSTHFWFDLQ